MQPAMSIPSSRAFGSAWGRGFCTRTIIVLISERPRPLQPSHSPPLSSRADQTHRPAPSHAVGSASMQATRSAASLQAPAAAASGPPARALGGSRAHRWLSASAPSSQAQQPSRTMWAAGSRQALAAASSSSSTEQRLPPPAGALRAGSHSHPGGQAPAPLLARQPLGSSIRHRQRLPLLSATPPPPQRAADLTAGLAAGEAGEETGGADASAVLPAVDIQAAAAAWWQRFSSPYDQEIFLLAVPALFR